MKRRGGRITTIEKAEKMQPPSLSLPWLGTRGVHVHGSLHPANLDIRWSLSSPELLNAHKKINLWLGKGSNQGHSNRCSESVKNEMVEKLLDLVGINLKIHRSPVGSLFCWMAFPWSPLLHFCSWLLYVNFFWFFGLPTLLALVELLKPWI